MTPWARPHVPPLIWSYHTFAQNIDISIVIINIDAIVVIVIAEERSEVSSPVFSAWMRGRFPIGMAAMRQSARIVTESHFSAFRMKNIAIGSRIILTAMYIQTRMFLSPSENFDLAMLAPRRVIERNTVAFPTNVMLFAIIGGGVTPNQKITRLSIAMMVPGLATFFIFIFSLPFERMMMPCV